MNKKVPQTRLTQQQKINQPTFSIRAVEYGNFLTYNMEEQWCSIKKKTQKNNITLTRKHFVRY